MRLVTTLRGPAQHSSESLVFEPPFGGHLSLQISEGNGPRSFRVANFGVAFPNIDTEKGSTGQLSIMGLRGRGKVAIAGQRLSCGAKVSAVVCYQAIERSEGFIFRKPDLYISPPEIFSGTLYLEAAIPDSVDGPWHSHAGSIQLHLVETKARLGYLRQISIPLEGQVFRALGGGAGAAAVLERKRIKLRPIGFANKDSDTNPSGSSWANQIKGAVKVWSDQCCIDFVCPDNPDILVIKNLKTEKSTDKILREFGNDDANRIEILFTKPPIGGGGGYTYSPGCGHAAIVLSDEEASNNSYLLAHELGHVFGALHPGDPRDPDQPALWVPEGATIHQPGLPDPSNTPRNCQCATNPKLIGTGGTCSG